MLSRKSTVLLSSYPSYSCFPSRTYTHPQSSYACTSCRPSTLRTYAQHAAPDSSSSSSSSSPPHRQSHCEEHDLSWPDPVHPHTAPSPYQILSLRKGDPYTKHRFYALAKLYHPDRCNASYAVAHIPPSVRLERYRLLVAAHEILSDHSKRRAYDLWGSGWAGHQHAMPAHGTYGDPSRQRTWPSGHDPMNNATWEDWERWYDREYGREQYTRAAYMSNFGFVSLVFALVSLGAIMQGTRANMFSATIIEHRDKVHTEASNEYMKSKRATMATGDREERIRTFLQHREATLVGEESYTRLLPAAEACSPDSIRKQ